MMLMFSTVQQSESFNTHVTHGIYMHFKFKSLRDFFITVTAGLLKCQNTFQRFVLGSNPKEIPFGKK